MHRPVVFNRIDAWLNQLFAYSEVVLECPTSFVPESMRQTGMKETLNSAKREAYSGADRESAAAD